MFKVFNQNGQIEMKFNITIISWVFIDRKDTQNQKQLSKQVFTEPLRTRGHADVDLKFECDIFLS